MILPSRLSATTLGDLLGRLYRQRTSGTLELSELFAPPGALSARHRIHLLNGLVSGVETTLTAPPLGELLRREGFLAEHSYRSLLRRIGDGDPRPAGEILIADRMVDAPTVDAALRVQLRMKLDALFELADAAVKFYSARPTRFMARRVQPLEPRDFLLGRPRARDRVPESEIRPRSRPVTPRPAPVWQDDPSVAFRATPPPPTSAPASSGKTANGKAAPGAHQKSSSSSASSSSARFGKLHGEARRHALEKLGLPASADEAAVRLAFRKLAVELHPDRHVMSSAMERDLNARRFAEVSAAYHALVA